MVVVSLTNIRKYMDGKSLKAGWLWRRRQSFSNTAVGQTDVHIDFDSCFVLSILGSGVVY